MAYDSIEPFGQERADLNAGIIASTIANVNRGKNTKAFSAQDFMPKFAEKGAEEEPYKQSTEEIKEVMMGLVEETKPKKKKKQKEKK